VAERWLNLPNSAMVPGVYRSVSRLRGAGEIVMEILRAAAAADLVTWRALENASAIVAATGGSTTRRCTFGDRQRGRIRSRWMTCACSAHAVIGTCVRRTYLAKDVYETAAWR